MSLYFSFFCIELGLLDLLRESLGKNESYIYNTQGFSEAKNKTIIETVKEEIQHLLNSCKQNEQACHPFRIRWECPGLKLSVPVTDESLTGTLRCPVL